MGSVPKEDDPSGTQASWRWIAATSRSEEFAFVFSRTSLCKRRVCWEELRNVFLTSKKSWQRKTRRQQVDVGICRECCSLQS